MSERLISNEKLHEIGSFIVNTNATIRDAAYAFNLSKTTVHKYMTRDLKEEFPDLWIAVTIVMEHHTQERAANGGRIIQERWKYESSVRRAEKLRIKQEVRKEVNSLPHDESLSTYFVEYNVPLDKKDGTFLRLSERKGRLVQRITARRYQIWLNERNK